MSHNEQLPLQGVAPVRFQVVVWVGELPPATILARLQDAGIGVISSRDAARASALLTHFRPTAFVSFSLEELLACADASTPVVLVGASPPDSEMPEHVLWISDPTVHALASAIDGWTSAHGERVTTAA